MTNHEDPRATIATASRVVAASATASYLLSTAIAIGVAAGSGSDAPWSDGLRWALYMGAPAAVAMSLGLIFAISPVAAIGAVPMAIGIFLLEIFVAFVQAYIFTMLSALFIGAGVESHGHGPGEEAHAHAGPGMGAAHGHESHTHGSHVPGGAPGHG